MTVSIAIDAQEFGEQKKNVVINDKGILYKLKKLKSLGSEASKIDEENILTKNKKINLVNPSVTKKFKRNKEVLTISKYSYRDQLRYLR